MEKSQYGDIKLRAQILKLAEQGTTVDIVSKELKMTRHNAFAWLKKLTVQRWVLVIGGEEPTRDSTFKTERQDNYMAHDPFGLRQSKTAGEK